MNMLLRSLVLAFLLVGVPLTFAASGVDLLVEGLITPDACLVSLSDDGMVDHGKIPARQLNLDEFTVLPSFPMALGVSCNAAVLFALVGVDNQADSSLAPDFFYGLGMNHQAPTERLGSVALSLRGPVADAQPMQTLTSSDQGATWHVEPNAYPNRFMAFAVPGSLIPVPLRNLVVNLRVDTSISPANNLTLKEEVPLDGLITLELRYL